MPPLARMRGPLNGYIMAIMISGYGTNEWTDEAGRDRLISQ
jgi:hypothetical protein